MGEAPISSRRFPEQILGGLRGRVFLLLGRPSPVVESYPIFLFFLFPLGRGGPFPITFPFRAIRGFGGIVDQTQFHGERFRGFSSGPRRNIRQSGQPPVQLAGFVLLHRDF